jgi:hypothetical protein
MKNALLAAIVFALGCIFSSYPVLAKDKTLDDVHLFQTFFRDSSIATTHYGEAFLQYDDYDFGTRTFLGLKGGFPIDPKLEIGARAGFINADPEHGESEFGLSDILVSGRYDIKEYMTFMPKLTKLAAGAYVTLPTGKRKIWEDKTDFGAFCAMRHPTNNGLVFTAVFGLDILDNIDRRGNYGHETSVLIGGGVISPVNDQLNIVGELNAWTEGDYVLLSGGFDYKLETGSRVRGALGLGLDDGAPDFSLTVSCLQSF